MAENIIYCYSGSGHCLNMAKTIAKMLGDTDIVMMRSFPAVTDAREAKRVGFIFSCFGGFGQSDGKRSGFPPQGCPAAALSVSGNEHRSSLRPAWRSASSAFETCHLCRNAKG